MSDFPTVLSSVVDLSTPLLAKFINNLEAKVGVDWSTVATSLDYLMRRAGGWIAIPNTLTYASADAPTFTFTLSGDWTSILYPGVRIQLTQTTVKYFIVTASSYGAPNTTVTVYGGTDYTLANAAITSPYFSLMKAPQGFPLDPTKWTVEVTDTTDAQQASPTQNTWYNLGSITISVPIGIWRLEFQVVGAVYGPAGGAPIIYITLSTANNTESDADQTSMCGIYTPIAGTSCQVYLGLYKNKTQVLASKTSYYLNSKTDVASTVSIHFRGDLGKTIIRATCAYL